MSDSNENNTPSPQESNPKKDTNSQNTGSSGENKKIRKPYNNRHRNYRYRKPKTDKPEEKPFEKAADKPLDKPLDKQVDKYSDSSFEKSLEQSIEKAESSIEKLSDKPANEKPSGEKNFQERHSQEKRSNDRHRQDRNDGVNKNRPQRHHQQKPQGYSQRNTSPEKLVKPNELVSVVIPSYNEEESLGELSSKLAKTFEELGCNYEVIYVDDGSTDNSFKKIREIRARNNRFHCIKFRRNYGKSAALAAGFKRAKGDIVITMDADLQDDPAEIPELIKVLNSGYDLVSGWKKVRYDPFIKKHTSKIFNYVTSKIAGVRLHDFNCGLKAYKKEVVKSVNVYGEMHRYIPALAHLSGFRVTEKPVKHHARKFGVTKFGASRFLNGFFDLLTVVFTTKFITKPLHLFGALGMGSFLAGFITILYLTYLKYFEDKPVSDRPLFLIGILFVIVGVQFITLGLIAEMITKSRPREEDSLIEASF